MRRSYNPNVPDTRTNDCLEITRRLYRNITDIAKRLDEQKGCALATTDIFTPSGEVLRAKLKDYCERLIFKDPVGHARKTEELLWRKGFYDAVATAKKLRKGNVWSETEKALLSCHLSVGVGYYHHLILKLQLDCDLDLSGIIDFAYPRNRTTSLSNEKSRIGQNKLLRSDEIRQCAIKIIHRSLICLGDLARYKLDVDPHWDPQIAARYYKIAVNIDPNIGMPHNQLGTMAGNKNHGLDAIYHYTRCILCPESFEGAEGNLKRVIAVHSYTGKEKSSFQKSTARLFSLLQLWETGKSSDSERINHACQELLIELENCLSIEMIDDDVAKSTINDEDSIDAYLMNLNNDQNPRLTDDMIFKIVAVCLMSIAKLQTRESLESQGAIAFTLTILSQLMQITIMRLQRAIMSINLPKTNDVSPEDNERLFKNDDAILLDDKKTLDNVIVEESSDDERVDVNDDGRKNKIVERKDEANGHLSLRRVEKKLRDKSKSLLTKLRRPRKRFNSSDSEGSEIEPEHVESSSDEIDSNMTESDEEEDDEDEDEAASDCNVITDDQRSEDKTDDENPDSRSNGNDHVVKKEAEVTKNSVDDIERLENDNETNKVVKVESNDKMENSDSAVTLTTSDEDTNRQSVEAALLRKKSLSSNVMIDIIGREGSLRSIKICFDWLRCNPEIFRMLAKNSGTSLKRVATLLNIINIDDRGSVSKGESEGDSSLSSGATSKFHEAVRKVPLSEDIELRGLKILEEAHKTIDWRSLRHTRLCGNEEAALRARKMIDFGNNACTIEDSSLRYDETRNFYYTIDLKPTKVELNEAKSNGKDTENEGSRGKLMRHMGRLWLKAEVRALESRLRSRLISPYLVPDQEALAKHTPALKRLVYAKKFIVIIPSVVVSALDEMKKTSSKAREATRWLEGQLRKGSRFLRAQRPHERLPLPLIKGPRTKDKDAWLFFQIIECCHYLTQQTKVGLNGDKEPPVVTLLTGFSLEERKASNFSPDGLSKTAGVNLEHIETFHTKWKTSSKSHG